MLRFKLSQPDESSECITIELQICHGKPAIRGLCYTVDTILELLSSGMTVEDILADYEDLEGKTFSRRKRKALHRERTGRPKVALYSA
jgi:uncharacterized protein (DUF433 family)